MSAKPDANAESYFDRALTIARWTTRLLALHAREHGPAKGHPCLRDLAQGTVVKILNEEEVKPHKVRYYLRNETPSLPRRWPMCCACTAR